MNICCFRDCPTPAERATFRLAIWPPSDLPKVEVFCHETCLHGSMHPSIRPDPPGTQGRIPAKASCLFCGKKLPIIGRHPYALELRDPDQIERYWAHAGCLEDEVDLSPG